MKPKQSGNVLFLILIAVALFAALSYAVTQSSRGGGNADDEISALTVSKVEQIVANIRVGITRLKINGCTDEDISFYSTLFASPAGYDNTNTPIAVGDFSCHLFHPDGAGISWFGEDLTEVCDPIGCGSLLMGFTGGFSVVDIGSSNADLMMQIDNISEEFCEVVNSRIGISGVPSDTALPQSADLFIGTYDDGSPKVIGDEATNLAGQDSGCYVSGTKRVYYATLLER